MIARYALASFVALAGLSSCGSSDATLQYSVFPTALTLSPVAWNDNTSKWSSVAVLNETYFPLELTRIDLVGTGKEFLELDGVGGASEVNLDLRTSRALRIRVKPPGTGGERTRWNSAEHEATLRFRVGGAGEFDPETQEIDPDSYVFELVEIPIKFELNCDLDGDGHDTIECNAGTDCDDRLVAVNPDATEYCDGNDNNCNGIIDDEPCVESP